MGVLLQSCARINAPIFPPPFKNLSAPRSASTDTKLALGRAQRFPSRYWNHFVFTHAHDFAQEQDCFDCRSVCIELTERPH